MPRNTPDVSVDLLRVGHVNYPVAAERRTEEFHAEEKHARAVRLKKQRERKQILENMKLHPNNKVVIVPVKTLPRQNKLSPTEILLELEEENIDQSIDSEL